VINPMTEHCGFIEKAQQFTNFYREFDNIQYEFNKKLSEFVDAKNFERIMYYPNRRIYNCAAVNRNSVIFGPNGLMYKCSLDVGDHFRAHDAIGEGEDIASRVTTPLSYDRWDHYDPFTHERCSECQYLPVCLGGCPRAQIEREDSHIQANSEFFENNFDDMIRRYYDTSDRA